MNDGQSPEFKFRSGQDNNQRDKRGRNINKSGEQTKLRVNGLSTDVRDCGVKK